MILAERSVPGLRAKTLASRDTSQMEEPRLGSSHQDGSKSSNTQRAVSLIQGYTGKELSVQAFPGISGHSTEGLDRSALYPGVRNECRS